MMALRLLFLVGSLLLAFDSSLTFATEDSVSVAARVDRAEIQIADPFELNVEVAAPHGSRVKFPEFDGRLGVFEILEVRGGAADQNDGSQFDTWTRTFLLETLESGSLEIPAIEVSVTQPDEASKLLRTDPVQISVTSLVEANADLTKFNDIAGLIDLEEPQSSPNYFAWGVFAAAAVALLAVAGILAWQARPLPYESAKAWALGQLDLADNDFNQVEGILRSFLGEKFQLPAESLGSVALATDLKDRNVDPAMVASVEEILATSERVKFGGYLLSNEQTSRWFHQTRDLIQRLDNEEAV